LPPGHTVGAPAAQYANAQPGSLAGRLGHSSRHAAPSWHETTLQAPWVQVNPQVLWEAQVTSHLPEVHPKSQWLPIPQVQPAPRQSPLHWGLLPAQ
jgi:hypothetical protein